MCFIGFFLYICVQIIQSIIYSIIEYLILDYMPQILSFYVQTPNFQPTQRNRPPPQTPNLQPTQHNQRNRSPLKLPTFNQRNTTNATVPPQTSNLQHNTAQHSSTQHNRLPTKTKSFCDIASILWLTISQKL